MAIQDPRYRDSPIIVVALKSSVILIKRSWHVCWSPSTPTKIRDYTAPPLRSQTGTLLNNRMVGKTKFPSFPLKQSSWKHLPKTLHPTPHEQCLLSHRDSLGSCIYGDVLMESPVRHRGINLSVQCVPMLISDEDGSNRKLYLDLEAGWGWILVAAVHARILFSQLSTPPASPLNYKPAK